MARRAKTLEQVEAMQRKAVRFAENVLLDDDKADELEELSPEDYAERKRIRIITPNPTKDRYMAATTVTKQELQDTLDEVGTKIGEMLNPALSREELVQQLQELDELVNGSDDDEDDEEDEDEDAEEN